MLKNKLKQELTAEDYMRLAVRKARQGVAQGQTPFGAVIVQQGKIVARTHNQVWQRTDITAHAEILALRLANRRLKGLHLEDATLYSTCEPCPMCLSACHWARIGTVVYGASIADAARYGFNELKISNREMAGMGRLKMKFRPGVLKVECLEVFRLWQASARHRSY
jgi:tRNA(Arg) A34 adenosine deaminase TadA